MRLEEKRLEAETYSETITVTQTLPDKDRGLCGYKNGEERIG